MAHRAGVVDHGQDGDAGGDGLQRLKAAVSHIGRHLAREWARTGPNVNNLCPGYIKSELVGDWFRDRGRPQAR
ncbi:hypothetical protein ACRAWD_10320 [Caulobacter segnis]